MNEHHIWCNFGKGPVDQCSMCKGLFEKYPYKEGETLEDFSRRYFPNAQMITGPSGLVMKKATNPVSD